MCLCIYNFQVNEIFIQVIWCSQFCFVCSYTNHVFIVRREPYHPAIAHNRIGMFSFKTFFPLPFPSLSKNRVRRRRDSSYSNWLNQVGRRSSSISSYSVKSNRRRGILLSSYSVKSSRGRGIFLSSTWSNRAKREG